MLRFAANLSFQYQEHDFLDRFRAAAEDGFTGVEYLFPYDHEPEILQAQLQQHRLSQVLFNAPPGDWAKGDRGIACLSGREDEFKRGVENALRYADVLGNQLIHVMSGLLTPEQDRPRHREIYLRNLAYATQQAAAHSKVIVIEPINPRDMPHYFLTSQREAHEICREIGATNLKVQADLYHCQIVEGDLTTMLRQRIQGIGHIQIAGVPDRHEPDQGEVNYSYLLACIESLGYEGWIGCEYRPKGRTSDGLGWIKKLNLP